jgi:glucokinase
LESTSQSYTSILTNDGPINTTYNVEVDAPLAVSISVRHAQVTLTEIKQKVTYTQLLLHLKTETIEVIRDCSTVYQVG